MNKNSRKEIGDALTISSLSYIKSNEIVQPLITKEWDTAEHVFTLSDLALKIIKSDGALFSIKVNQQNKQKYIHSTKLGQRVISGLKINIHAIKQCYPIHRIDPYIELMIRCGEGRNLNEIANLNYRISDDSLLKCCDSLNGFIEDTRKESTSAKFKKSVSDFQRVSNKNYKEMLKYTNALFDNHSRILAIRLDLGYLMNQSLPPGIDSPVKYEDVKKHWSNLLSYLNKKLPPGCMVGFAWKLEYGRQKLFHYHLIVFLRGAEVREDVTIAKMIGDHWSSVITSGKGLYYNCNAYKSGYKYCGIGMINHWDTTAREGLNKAIFYMTKTDYLIKMIAPGNGRTFGKGNMPKPKSSTVGRPRTKKDNHFQVMPSIIWPV